MTQKQLKKLVPEKDHQAACIELCESLGIVVWRNNTGALPVENRFVRFGLPGSPDIIGHIPEWKLMREGMAVPFYWEVKRSGGGSGRPKQKAFIENASGAGCFAGIGTVDDLMKELNVWGLLK